MTNPQKTASQMLHPELDIVDRLLTKDPRLLAEDMDLAEAATEIRNLRHEIESLTRTIEDLQDTSWTRGSD
jgi:ubiquinone biosynthesis protein UbiJ